MRILLAGFIVLLVASSSFAQDSERIIIQSDASFSTTIADWFKPSNCPASDKGAFHFRVGEQVFTVPVATAIRGRFRRIAGATMDKSEKLRVPVAKTTGCKSNSLDFLTIEIESQMSDLPKYIVLTETAERSGPKSGVTRYIEHLNATKACQDTKERNLILCAGSRTVEGRKVTVFFMIVTDDRKTIVVPSSGVPVHARCEDLTGEVQCVVNEELPGNVTAKAWIDRATLTADNITSLSQRLVRFANERRLSQ